VTNRLDSIDSALKAIAFDKSWINIATKKGPLGKLTGAASVPLVGGFATFGVGMSRLLDKRIAFRLPFVIAGARLVGGRRTAASWLRCAGVNDDWDCLYELLQSMSKDAASLKLPILMFIFKKFESGKQGYWTMAIDDSPTKGIPICLLGNFNQRIPPIHRNKGVFPLLQEVLQGRFKVWTEGETDCVGKQLIDHVATTDSLQFEFEELIPMVNPSGQRD
jgi:hypothetical protein